MMAAGLNSFDMEKQDDEREIELSFEEQACRCGYMHKAYYTPREVAWILDVPRSTIEREMESGRLEHQVIQLHEDCMTAAQIDAWLYQG